MDQYRASNKRIGMDLKNVRAEYLQQELHVDDLHQDPFEQLRSWFDLALKANLNYPNAADLATVDHEGQPHSRIILIKDILDDGVTFFTNYESDKALHIDNNPKVGLNLFWKELDRQVRILGQSRKLSQAESEAYFQSRPLESQISAFASKQSRVTDKNTLLSSVANVRMQFQDLDKLPCPPYWGGYHVKIHQFEFWQGRPTRLHDRFRYRLENFQWIIERLAP
jgi:pyridoxamine 5'-phosphate oxidase